jgi:SAM-dependent methyltransferase
MSIDATWADSMPAAYDQHLGPALFRPFARELASRAAALDPKDVLELAAGTGIVTAELVRTLPSAQITATDLNPPMVGWAAEHVPGARCSVEDAQALSLPDASYDLVVCQFGVMFFPDKPKAYGEMARVLRPGGTALVAVWDVVETAPFPTALMASLAVVLPEQPPDFVVRVPHGYADPQQIRADAEAGGLTVSSVEQVVVQGTARSARDLAKGYCLGSPLRFELEQRGDVDELVDAIGAEMERRLGPGELTGDLAAWVLTAQRASQ